MKTKIQNSVLPLNKDRSVYHLHLHPEDIADTIILVGNPDRVALISRHFSSVEVKKQHREFVTHTGLYHHKRITVISTGIGAGNIDIVLTELDALKNIDLKSRYQKEQLSSLSFIRLGTTGALQENITPGSPVISAFAAGFDGLMHFYQHNARIPGLHEQCLQKLENSLLKHNLYTSSADPILLQQFDSLGTKGITLTAHGFYGAQNREVRAPLSTLQLLDPFQNLTFRDLRVTNFEMETAMIYALSQLLGHKAISISSAVYNRITDQAAPHPAKSMANLIERTLNLLSEESECH